MASPYSDSYYAHTANPHAPFETLNGEIEANVAIVGGGFTGVATALELVERGMSVAVLETNRIGWGATSRNGGQITGSLSGDKAMMREFARSLGTEEAREFVWKFRWRGHDIVRKHVARYGISCDLKSGHMHAAWKTSHIPKLEEMFRLACAHGMQDEVEMVYGDDVARYVGTPLYPAGLVNRRNMHVHSLNLCLGEAEAARQLGARIFEDAKVLDITHGHRPEVRTANGRVRANKVLLAGNAYHRLARRQLGGLLFPASLGVVATEPLAEETARSVIPQDIGVYDTRFVLDYYRLTADRRLLFGGGTNYSGRESSDIAAELRPALECTFPQLKGVGIDLGWQGQAGITLNRIPQVGRVSDNVFYAQGYSGHGIAVSHIVAEIMAQAISNEAGDYELLADARKWRLPVGRFLGNQLLALGMRYFQLREALR